MPSTIRGSDNFDSAGGNACKAWVNFNGTGTVAIRASFNVSSITDNGVGDYTVNFTSALADANYSAIAVLSNILATLASGSVNMFSTGSVGQQAPTTTAFRFVTPSYNWTGGSGGQHDPQYVNVAVFR